MRRRARRMDQKVRHRPFIWLILRARGFCQRHPSSPSPRRRSHVQMCRLIAGFPSFESPTSTAESTPCRHAPCSRIQMNQTFNESLRTMSPNPPARHAIAQKDKPQQA